MRALVSARAADKSTLRLAHNRIWGLAPMCRHLIPGIVGRGVPLRCLIVDDNAGFRDEMRALLEEEGISVVGDAASGNEALRKVRESRPDVVLIDIDLRGVGGLE